MKERKFNLVDEPWILVRKPDETVESVSLKDALLQSQNYLDLAGETDPQNAAILRILLAIVHKAILENDPDGHPDLLEDPVDALERWSKIWNQGVLPAVSIERYLEEHHDEFWLIDEDNPFFQAPMASIGTHYDVSKLIGNLAESSNKLRLFSSRAREGKKSIDYAESARWTCHLNSYDDTSAKKKGNVEEKLSPGAGWLGKIGQIYASGQSLFETLMLNCVLLRSESEVYPPDHPSWEEPQSRWKQRHHVPQPEDFSGLMTWRSRLILLETNDDRVTGYTLLGGEFFDRENCFVEPFTLWKTTRPKKSEPAVYVPKRHSSSRQLWRDFSSLILPRSGSTGSVDRSPGIIDWLSLLVNEEILDDEYPLILKAPYVTYGDKDFFVTDVSSQNLRIQTGLLGEPGQDWLERIAEQIAVIDKAALYAGYYYENLLAAKGAPAHDRGNERAKGMAALYSLINEPFSSWLASISVEKEAGPAQQKEKVQEWVDTIVGLINRWRRELLEEQVFCMDPAQLFGRVVVDEKGNEQLECSLRADMIFASQIRKLYPAAKIYQEERRLNDEQTK